jgi:ATP synthase protein I
MNDTDVRLVGTALVVPIVIGLVVGYLLDRLLGSAPWLAMIGLGFGIATGFVNLSRSVKRH